MLAQHGIDLTVVRRAAELAKAEVDADTTVMVTSPGNLGRMTATQVRGAASADAGQVVLAEPEPDAASDAFDLPVEAGSTRGRPPGGSRAATTPWSGDLTLEVGPSTGYRGEGSDVSECFQGRGREPGSLWSASTGASPSMRSAGPTCSPTTGSTAPTTRPPRCGCWARTAGWSGTSRTAGTSRSATPARSPPQLPRGLVPALWLLAAAALATMLWRGRRLGPLVVEPLPVAVKAVESTQGRGRLYRRVRDRPHASTVLRAATMRRLVTLLRLPADSDPWHVAEAAARVVGRDPRAVHDVLVARPVTDDAWHWSDWPPT